MIFPFNGVVRVRVRVTVRMTVWWIWPGCNYKKVLARKTGSASRKERSHKTSNPMRSRPMSPSVRPEKRAEKDTRMMINI